MMRHRTDRIREAEVAVWLGRRVCVVTTDAEESAIGRLDHVSSHAAFIENDDTNDAGGVSLRLIPFARIARVELL